MLINTSSIPGNSDYSEVNAYMLCGVHSQWKLVSCIKDEIVNGCGRETHVCVR